MGASSGSGGGGVMRGNSVNGPSAPNSAIHAPPSGWWIAEYSVPASINIDEYLGMRKEVNDSRTIASEERSENYANDRYRVYAKAYGNRDHRNCE